MNRFRQNRFAGTFLIVFALATLGALYFLWSARSRFEVATTRFGENASELNRLQRLTPYPNDVNLRKIKTQAEEYAAELKKLKEDLSTHVLPVPAEMKPNEFQARLRQAITSLGEKARANKVKLPDNFALGFEEFTAALPDTAAAPWLGQQLAQMELLVNIMIDAHVETVTSLRRVPATEQLLPALAASTPVRKPAPATNAPAPVALERNTIETAFSGSPGAARRVLNQISTASQQFYIVRSLRVLNEKDKGPAREGAAASAVVTAPGAQPTNAALNFIVGNERVQTSARIEMVRFAP